jgi:hypothetical protein
LRSRWTTPAEWTYFRPRYKHAGQYAPARDRKHGAVRTHHDLVQEILDELFFEWSRGQKPVEVGAEKFRDEVATEQH